MKTIKIAATCSLFLLAMVGCDLTGLNENPNEPTADVDYNLNDARLASELRAGQIMEGDNEQRIKSLEIDFYSQMLDASGNWPTKNYLMNEDWNVRMFEHIQTRVSSLNIVIRNLSEREDYFANAIAIAKIWRVYVHSRGVDFFGPIPFATYKEVEANPPYKSVQDTYTEFFQELEGAIALLDKGSSTPIFNDAASDIMYKNDTKKWRKFANSLRLRLALRLSEVAPDVCKTQATAALASGVMESSADKAQLPPRADDTWGQNYNYVMFQIDWSGPLNMTASFEKLVSNIGGITWPDGVVNLRPTLSGNPATPVSSVHPAKVDPRAPIMFSPAMETGDWKGKPYALSATDATSKEYTGTRWPELGILIKNGIPYKTRPYDVFLFEEVCFLKAEAALRGFTTGNAKDEYEKGVRASFETWGVADQADAYLASAEKNTAGTSAKFDDQSGAGNTAIEKIITQKYIASFPDVAWEAWNDKRRLNLPRMDVAIFRDQLLYGGATQDIKDPKNFIKRVQYPQKEITINKAEYDKGVQLLGGADNVTTAIWWDKNTNLCTSAQ